MIRFQKNRNREPYVSLRRLLGFYPNNIALYEEAFLHTSAAGLDKGKWHHNERLEFLGDAVLDAVVADILYKHFPEHREGFLTNTRSKIVQRENLNRVAEKLGLNRMLVLTTRLNTHNNYVYGNALEALIGAIYLDRGYRKCYRFIDEVIIRKCVDLDGIARKKVNFKSSLIEWSQKNKLEIAFGLIESFTDGDGSPVFQSEVTLLNNRIGLGTGYSKKESQQNAAKMAIKKLRTDKGVQRLVADLKRKRNSEASGSGVEELPEEALPVQS
jgi:ribonuclease-3